MAPTSADVTRFERFVSPEPNSGCWLFTGTLIGAGYGGFHLGGRKGSQIYAHRFAYRVWRGDIPAGLCVCHRCDVPSCVNPEHLFLGTQQDNLRDMVAKGRHPLTNRPRENAAKTHCKYGHPLSGRNLAVRADGARLCKECRARIQRNNRSRKHGE